MSRSEVFSGHSRDRIPYVELQDCPDEKLVEEICGGNADAFVVIFKTISTVHANSAAQGISRFTTCVLQSGIEIPYVAIKTNIAESLDVIVHIERRPGQRRVAEVLALRGFDSDLDKYNFDFLYLYRAESRHDHLTPEEWQ